ncbi:MAG: NAD-dependent epimerase/dehydratase family protein, partial [Chloroflexia bacterium]|nr:NAD-dependent epimerase/dehydratase family protein [Chloroflexia bacterium]
AQYRADPTQRVDLDRLLDETAPEVIVNLVAMTNVDTCEKNPQAAYRANVLPVELLCDRLGETACHLVQVSTDQVYDGPGPHIEDRVDPCNVYALSKYAAELVATGAGGTILRTNFVGRSHLPGRVAFSDWLVHAFRERQPITLFDDVRFSALHMAMLCVYIEHVATKRLAGTYNLGCRDSMSKAQFALRLAEQLGLDSSHATIGRVADVALGARRPPDMSLTVTRFEQTFGHRLPTMEQTVQRLARDYQDDNQRT